MEAAFSLGPEGCQGAVGGGRVGVFRRHEILACSRGSYDSELCRELVGIGARRAPGVLKPQWGN